MSYRWWFCTIFERVEPCEAGFAQLAQKLEADYMYGQFETCPSTGRIHCQAVVWYPSNVRITHLSKRIRAGHYEKCGSEQALAYCGKEETRLAGPFTIGDKPLQRNKKEDWEEIKKNA